MSGRGRRRAWAELLRVSAVFTVPGDALAGAAAAGVRPGARTGLAVGASVCLYEAGMALNDWADREEDAAERPERPIPSGRIRPGAALAAAGGLTAAGLVLAACAGRRAAAVAGALAGTVWAYDLGLKHTKAGPAAMAAARSLDLLLGAAAASPGGIRPALPSALALGGHTYAVTAVSRRETQGGATLTSLAALAGTALLAAATTRPTTARTWTGLGLAGLAALPEPGVLSAPAGPGAASALAGPALNASRFAGAAGGVRALAEAGLAGLGLSEPGPAVPSAAVPGAAVPGAALAGPNLNLPRLAEAAIALPALPEPGPSGPRPAETAGRVRALAEAGLAGAWRLTGPGRGPAALAGLVGLVGLRGPTAAGGRGTARPGRGTGNARAVAGAGPAGRTGEGLRALALGLAGLAGVAGQLRAGRVLAGGGNGEGGRAGGGLRVAAADVVGRAAGHGPAGAGGLRGPEPAGPAGPWPAGAVHAAAGARLDAGRWAGFGMAALYAGTVGRPLVHAVLNPSPPLTQKAVGGGIRAMIPLQAALAARAGAPGTALALAGLVPVARRLARKVNPT